MKKMKWRVVFRAACFVLLLVLLLSICNYTIYNDSNHRRVMMHEMYTHEPSVDLAFLGGSVAYVHFDPQIWDKTLDMQTFNVGSDAQTPDATYFLLKELFKYHNPKYCIYATSYLSFVDRWEVHDPMWDYLLYDYFRPSFNKIAYGVNAFDDEAFLGAIFPFLREKGNISFQLISDTIKAKQDEKYKSYDYANHITPWAEYKGKGFVAMHVEKQNGNVGKLQPTDYSDDVMVTEYVEYFARIVELCKANDCELIMVSPPIPYAAMEMQDDYQRICDLYSELANRNGVALFDFSLSKPTLLCLKDADFYDYVHMNETGAEKFSVAASGVIEQYIHGKEVDEEQLFYNNYRELLEASPYIFNTWLDSADGGYVAKSTYGTGVIPEYRFFVRDEETAPWKILYSYGEKDNLSRDDFPENTIQIRIEARPQGSSVEYQQYDIYSLSD